ncbi:MAG: hypothetical protein C5B47_01500 [Verrucomicrobia bacterium]|nr:MAG: hypothetical protein C5B47_01500 [Verrucomicrobiota bacterium]
MSACMTPPLRLFFSLRAEEDASSSGKLLFARLEGGDPLNNKPGCIAEVEAPIEGDDKSLIPETVRKDNGLPVRTNAVSVGTGKRGFVMAPIKPKFA